MGKDKSVNYEKISFVERAPNRQKILKVLNSSDVYTPSELEEETGIKVQNVSRSLGELREKDLVRCLTPNANKHRYYEITKEGLKILKELNNR